MQVTVTNRGDRPIQVGSHYHFAQTNRALEFDRTVATGRRLDIPRGRRCDSSPARHERWRSSKLRATASCEEVCCEPPDAAAALRRHLRPDNRRSRPTCGHGSHRRGRARSHRLWRRVQVRRRQGAARRHGPGRGSQRGSRARPRDYQRAHHRLDGHLQGGRRREARPDCGHRQSRQSRRDGRRLTEPDRRRHDRGDCRRGVHPDRRRDRRAHSLHLSAAGRRRARERRDDVHRRRHRTCDGHEGDDMHARIVVSREDAAIDGRRCR